MTYTNQASKLTLAALALYCSAVGLPSLAADPAPSAPIAGTWVRHEDTFSYYGLTALYSCSSIEDKVKDILVDLGARKDAVVLANGCPQGNFRPGRIASVRAKFYTLAPVEHGENGNAPGVVGAQWAALELSPGHPFFVGDGDCELIQDMKDLLSKNFSLRDLKYRTDCVPFELQMNGFAVTGEVFKALPPARVSRTQG
jgi:hypothetical protein